MAQYGACLIVENPEDIIPVKVTGEESTDRHSTKEDSQSASHWHFERATTNRASFPCECQQITHQKHPVDTNDASSPTKIFLSQEVTDGTMPNNCTPNHLQITSSAQQQLTNPYRRLETSSDTFAHSFQEAQDIRYSSLPRCACHNKPINPALLNIPMGPSGSQTFNNLPPTSIPVMQMVNNNSAKRFTPIQRTSPYIRPKAEAKSKCSSEGILGRVAKYCRLKRLSDHDPRSPVQTPPFAPEIQATGDPNGFNKLHFTKERLSIQFGPEGSSEISTVSSLSSVRYDRNNQQPSAEDQLTSQMSAIALGDNGAQHAQDQIAIEYHPVLRINQVNNAAPQVENNLAQAARSSQPRKEPRTFGNQNVLHFATDGTQPRGKSLPSVTSINDVSVEMKSIRCCSRARPPTQFITCRGDDEQDIFGGRKMLKKRFYLLESAKLEEMLADSEDRRIKAICNRFHCEMQAFAKAPRKGSLQNAIVISGFSLEDIAKCARCLDARLSWCISPQLK